MSQPQPPPHETIIDARYRVVRLLGEGGFGQVFECQHVGTRRAYAVKLLLPEIARRPGVLTRFMWEAETAGSIKSPHVVDVLDVGQCRTTGAAFLAMELLSGHDLAKQLEARGPLSPDLALRVAAQTLTGLAKAHARGIVHRDVKPPNLFLARTEDGHRKVTILDFGIAKVLGAEDVDRARLTVTGSILGSPWYMSPEQAAGVADIDHRTDIWSLGAVLYEALAGVTPYHGVTTLQQLLRRICDGPPEPLSERAPHVPPGLVALVTKAMAHPPAGRYQTAAAMLEDVQRLLGGPATIPEAMIGTLDAPAAGASSADAPSARGHTRPMSAAPQVSTHAGLARSVQPPSRRAYVLAVAAAAGSVGLAALVLTLVPKPDASSTHVPEAAPSEPVPAAPGPLASTGASSVAGGGSSAPALADDAGSPPDAGAEAGAAPTNSLARPPPKQPASTPIGKPGSLFDPGKKGI